MLTTTTPCFASKRVRTAQGERTIVFVVIRGTPLSANEWVSNLDIGEAASDESDRQLHAGFIRATEQVQTAFYAYLLEKKIDVHASSFLITGHSRGAAVANLLGAQLIENRLFSAQNLHVYTFATPNVTTDANAGDAKYGFIWNIVNAEDIVPCVPLARNDWRYRKYGNVLALANAWNVDAAAYQTDYLPRVNAVYRQLLERDYAPFGIGAFIPIELTRFLSSFNKSVAKYYSRGFGLHNKAEKILWKVFPEPQDDDRAKPRDGGAMTADANARGNGGAATANANTRSDGGAATADASARGDGGAGKSTLADSLVRWLNGVTDGLVDYAMLAFADMHANEVYLSWMLALDECELFSTLGSTQLVLHGDCECAVFSESGEVLLRVTDSTVRYRSLRLPIAAWQISPYEIAIGLPTNADFTVVVYHSSHFPTPVAATLEHYDASGRLVSVGKKERLLVHKGMAVRFAAGACTLDADTVTAEKIRGKVAKGYIKSARLSDLWTFKGLFETALNSNWNLSGGVQFGPPVIYGSVLLSHRTDEIRDTLQASAGVGTQQTLIGTLQLDIEGFCHFVQDFDTQFDDDDTSGFNFVPALRLSLSLKPKRRVQLFGALCYDFCIDGFNDGAFGNALRTSPSGGIEFGSRVSAVPSVQAGIKF